MTAFSRCSVSRPIILKKRDERAQTEEKRIAKGQNKASKAIDKDRARDARE